ncbi:MAG: hypothetical protein CL730_00055 [Chloroflexi bacterium]|jgi:hypothetical protein|nr:hypothetical protein [Chloroflexota bacterium]|tara:strand:+ start:8115 stop:8387 length:273 start_codon:yes stop_codon:yes gene_type:complete
MYTEETFEGKFNIGDRIRALDFQHTDEHYIEGEIIDMGLVNSQSYGEYGAYTITVDNDSKGRRVGMTSFIPFQLIALGDEGKFTRITLAK